MAITLMLALVLSACGGDNDDGSEATTASAEQDSDEGESIAQDGCDAVVVGVVMSTSGAYSQLGADAKIAVDAFSESHPEILGTPLEFRIENDGSDPTQAVSAAERLYGDDCVVAVVGPTGGQQMLAMTPVAVEAQKPTMFLVPIPYPGMNEEPYLFSPNMVQVGVQKSLFEAYWEEMGVENPVVITGADASGDAVAQVFSADWDVEQVPGSVTDYEPVIAELQDAGYDAVAYVGAGGAPAGHIARAKQALDWDVDYYQAPSTLNADYFELAGDAAEGTRGLIWPAGMNPEQLEDEAQRARVEELQSAVGPEVDLSLQPLVGGAWDQLLSLYLAMEEAASSDPDVLQEVLDGQSFYGANGPVNRVPVGEEGADHIGASAESTRFAVVEDGTLVLAE